MATQKEIGDHLDLSDRQVRNLVKDAVLPGGKPKLGMDIDASRYAYINYLRALSRQPTKQEVDGDFIDIEQERARLVQAQRIAQELKNDIFEGRSIPADIARDVLSKILVQVTGLLTTLPLEVKRTFPDIDKRVTDKIHAISVRLRNEAATLDDYIDQAIDDVISESEEKV